MYQMNSDKPLRALVIEDDKPIGDFIRQGLQEAGFLETLTDKVADWLIVLDYQSTQRFVAIHLIHPNSNSGIMVRLTFI